MTGFVLHLWGVLTLPLYFRSRLATEVVLHWTVHQDSKIHCQNAHFHSIWRKQNLAEKKYVIALILTCKDFAGPSTFLVASYAFSRPYHFDAYGTFFLSGNNARDRTSHMGVKMAHTPWWLSQWKFESFLVVLWNITFPVIVVMVRTRNFPLSECQKVGRTQVCLLYLSFQPLFQVYLQHSVIKLKWSQLARQCRISLVPGGARYRCFCFDSDQLIKLSKTNTKTSKFIEE